MYRIIKRIKIILLSTIFLFIIGCSFSNSEIANWPQKVERVWIGPEFWTNPMQDWQLNDGRVECVSSGGERNVVWLTKELSAKNEPFEMQIDFGQLNKSEILDSGWVGFWAGVRGNFEDYRNATIRGEGFPVGLSTSGVLFIGNKKDSSTKIKAPFDRLSMYLSAKVLEGVYNLNLVIRNERNEILAEISENTINSDWLKGMVAVVCSRGAIPLTPEKRREIPYPHFGNKPGTERGGNVSFWFRNWKISGTKVEDHPERAFGPILFTQYTLSKKTVKLMVQLPPVGENDGQTVRLALMKNNKWETVSEQGFDADSRSTTFRIENWTDSSDTPYRVIYDLAVGPDERKTYHFEGTIRHEPNEKEEIVIAGFTGNNDLGFPNNELVDDVKFHNPDLLFFSGDQIYEGVGGFYTQTEPIDKSCIDYLRKWYLYGWAYRDILRDRPSIAIPDDHDMYHGNIWGAGGIATPEGLSGSEAADAGGYKMPARWVNMVQRTQTSHLPDPFDPTPVAQGIGVYYTDLNYAGISFAILEDRKFKSAPKTLLPEAKVVNGWAQNKNFNMKKYGDVKDAVLLGERQQKFLENWTSDWSNQSWMKVLLSQTIFANVATLPLKDATSDRIVPKLRILEEGEYPPNDIPVSDMDSNGWPKTPRDNALIIIRKAFGFHIAGDQHLGSFIKYGVDEWNDAGYAFCVPSISNVWPRRWFPNVEGKNRNPKDPKYTGDFEDGFGNKISVFAVSNPVFTGKKPSNLYDRATGYGIVRFNKKSRDITVECWPRGVDPSQSGAKQYPGWPIVINQIDNYNRDAVAWLPKLKIQDIQNPVIKVIDERTKEIIYTIRINGNQFQPRVFNNGTYSVKIGQPDENLWKTLSGIKSKRNSNDSIISIKLSDTN